MLSNGQEVILFIEKLLYGGSGLSHFGMMACFIDDVIPGETVLASVDAIKNHYATASLQDILEPSPFRTEPTCVHFKICGGCQWQHIDYTCQLHWKSLIVKECIDRIGRIPDTSVLEALPSPSAFQYRSRTNLKVSASGSHEIGYYQRGTHHIIPITCCPLLTPALNQALAYCTSLRTKNTRLFTGVTEIQLLLINSGNKVIITLLAESAVKSFLLYVPDKTPDDASNAASAISNIEYTYRDNINGISFYRSPLTFYQVNREQNVAMINIALKYLSRPDNKRILDLYCGCGNFSLFLARAGAHVVGIDSNSTAITEARRNADANRLQHCTYICGDVEKEMKKFATADFHSVLINPPRRGCPRKTLDYINQINPQIIVYVSCNPATLARDLTHFIDHGYQLEIVQPIDMFPQTFHIETMVKLVKS